MALPIINDNTVYTPSVSDLKQRILNPALTNTFICTVNAPEKLRNPTNGWLASRGNAYAARQLQIACCEVSLPGSTLMTNEISDDYTGVTERYPYRRQFDDRMDITFYVSAGTNPTLTTIDYSSYYVIRFFEDWIAFITSEDRSESPEEVTFNYKFKYPEDYVTEIFIYKFEKNIYEGSYLEYKLIGAYPISISSMPLSYDSNDILKCTISFSYMRYVLQSTSPISKPKPPTPPASPTSASESDLQRALQDINYYAGVPGARSSTGQFNNAYGIPINPGNPIYQYLDNPGQATINDFNNS